jgi:hypothetical protein
MYETPVARLLTRLQGEGDGLMLGALLKSGQGYFKPNSIYEVIYCPLSEEIKIKYHGPSCIAGTGQTYRATWCTNVEDVLLRGQEIFLTPDELSAVFAQREAEWLARDD